MRWFKRKEPTPGLGGASLAYYMILVSNHSDPDVAWNRALDFSRRFGDHRLPYEWKDIDELTTFIREFPPA